MTTPTPQQSTADLIAQIRPRVAQYCRARLGGLSGGYDLAEDVAQEVCLACWAALPTYRDQGRPFLAFALAIAAHKVVDAQRAAARTATVSGGLPERADAAPGPEQAAVQADLVRRMWTILRRLPNRERAVLVLHIGYRLDARDVAERLDMTEGNVRVLQARLLTRLRTAA